MLITGALSGDGEFFVSSSTRPFQSKPLSGFYTGSQFSTFGSSPLWAASPTTDNLLNYVTPDSGVEDMTTPPANSSQISADGPSSAANSSQSSTETANSSQMSTEGPSSSANSSEAPTKVDLISTSVYNEEDLLLAKKMVDAGLLSTNSSVYKEDSLSSANDSQVFKDSGFSSTNSSVHKDGDILSANSVQVASDTELLSANQKQVSQETGLVLANSSVEAGLLGIRRPARESLTLDLPMNHNSQLGLVLDGIKKSTAGVEFS